MIETSVASVQLLLESLTHLGCGQVSGMGRNAKRRRFLAGGPSPIELYLPTQPVEREAVPRMKFVGMATKTNAFIRYSGAA